MDKITVLMAVYDPPERWLIEQLQSIDRQTYSNIELVIRDDCSPNVDFHRIQQLVSENMRRVPYRILRNEKNLGSTKTFECLTREASGDYFAYCDQDDIWNADKLEKSWKTLTEQNCVMLCSNADVIDGDDVLQYKGHMSIPDSFSECIRSGEAWKTLLVKNYFWGCTLMIRADIAKQSLPFLEGMYHDQYLELFASMQGNIYFLNESLMQYRIHGSNQTGFLKNVCSKRDYYENRICILIDRYQRLLDKKLEEPYCTYIRNLHEWAVSRKEYAEGKWTALPGVLKGRMYNRNTTLFELCMMPLPNFIWVYLLRVLKKLNAMRHKNS